MPFAAETVKKCVSQACQQKAESTVGQAHTYHDSHTGGCLLTPGSFIWATVISMTVIVI